MSMGRIDWICQWVGEVGYFNDYDMLGMSIGRLGWGMSMGGIGWIFQWLQYDRLGMSMGRIG